MLEVIQPYVANVVALYHATPVPVICAAGTVFVSQALGLVYYAAKAKRYKRKYKRLEDVINAPCVKAEFAPSVFNCAAPACTSGVPESAYNQLAELHSQALGTIASMQDANAKRQHEATNYALDTVKNTVSYLVKHEDATHVEGH